MKDELSYWREKNAEVDFVCRYQGKLYAIEVKSGRKKSAKGLDAFAKQFPEACPVILTGSKVSHDPERLILVGGQALEVWGVMLDCFLRTKMDVLVMGDWVVRRR